MLRWFPLLWAQLTRRKARTCLTLVSVAASFALFGLLESFRYAISTFGDDYADVLVVQSRNVPLPFSHVASVRQIPGVESACGYMLVFSPLGPRERLLVQAVGDRDVFEVHRGLTVDARARALWHQDRLSALIDARLAAERGWKPGDRVMLPGPKRGVRFQRPDGVNALEVVIAGVFSASNQLAAGRIFVRYDYVRDVVGAERAGLEYIAARVGPPADVDAMRARIDAEFASSAAPVRTYSSRALMRAYYATFRDISQLALVVLSVSFVTLLLIAGSVLIQAQRERVRELATLQALGTSRPRLVALLLGEALALIAPAALAGLAVASFIARRIPTDVRVVSDGLLSAHTLTVAAVLVVALGVAISILPCRSLLRLPLATNLARE